MTIVLEMKAPLIFHFGGRAGGDTRFPTFDLEEARLPDDFGLF